MKRYKYILNFSYDGSSFRGYGTQLHKNTVQDTLEEVLKKLNSNNEVKTFASSRTDAYVHAYDQFLQVHLNFKYDQNILKHKLNRLLPNAILIKNVYYDFEDKLNVRYDVLNKTYKYVIGLEESPFFNEYIYFEKCNVDIVKMKEASTIFIGENDFSAFCNSNTRVENKIRTVFFINIEENHFRGIRVLEISINANGFLYNMVRILVGVLLEVGKGKIELDEIKRIKQSKKRSEKCVCVSPQGLYLEKINLKEVL